MFPEFKFGNSHKFALLTFEGFHFALRVYSWYPNLNNIQQLIYLQHTTKIILNANNIEQLLKNFVNLLLCKLNKKFTSASSKSPGVQLCSSFKCLT